MVSLLSSRIPVVGVRVFSQTKRTWHCFTGQYGPELEKCLKSLSLGANQTFQGVSSSQTTTNMASVFRAYSTHVSKNSLATCSACRQMANTSSPSILMIQKGNRQILVRYCSSRGSEERERNIDMAIYIMALAIFFGGLTYTAVPMFKMFCRQFGLGGNPEFSKGHDKSKVSTMKRVDDRVIKVNFEADRHTAMRWNFQPQQKQITIKPGETALAFYRAENPTDKPIIGISTYTITPYKAAPYFNKIQCFCFEEQILNPHEKVDMPVFFYIDPDYDEDPNLEFDDEITLSYTFFQAKEGLNLPLPGFLTNKA